MPDTDPWAGRVLAGRYQLTRRLTRRPTTVTYLAFDRSLSRPVLVHVLIDPASARSILDAARRAAAATDSRFLRVLDASAPHDGQPAFVVAEYAPGRSLADLLIDGPLSAFESAWVIGEIAHALQPMHADGLFHLRLNPDTVILTETGNVKVVGLLVEAALDPDASEERMPWAGRERADLRSLGMLLYACLVARWPTVSGRRTLTYGLEPAPAAAEGWLPTRQVRAGVSPRLDAICEQLMAPHAQPTIRSCGELIAALTGVSASSSAAADLERRMRRNSIDQPSAVNPRTAPDSDATVRFTSPVAPDAWQSEREAPTRVQPAIRLDPAPAAVEVTDSSSAPELGRGGQRPHIHERWLAILASAVSLVIAGSLVIGLARSQPSAGGSASAPTSPVSYTISSVDDFDPASDGGNGEENPTELGALTDSNPATAWHTLTYRDDPKLGGLKPGVGVIVDLGEPKLIGTVTLTLVGGATSVQIRVPKTQTDQAPTDTVNSWRVVAANTAATASVQLTPTEAVTSRFVLVYLIQLPQVATARYQAGIAEISVSS